MAYNLVCSDCTLLRRPLNQEVANIVAERGACVAWTRG